MPATSPILSAITLDGYKCFARAQRLALKPMTLLYGRNNAGKSAVLRALAIIGRSVGSNASSPWDMGEADGPGKGGTFQELPWRGRQRRDFTLVLEWTAEQPITDRFLLTYTDEDAIVPAVRPDEPQGSPTLRHELEHQLKNAPQRFLGLMPMPGHSDALDQLAQRLQGLRGDVQWLRGGRLSPPRFIPFGSNPSTLRSDGQNAGHKLISNWRLIGPDVQAFYALVGRNLQQGKAVDRYVDLLLDADGLAVWKMRLGEVGEGMSTVLPVLVAVASAVRGCGPKLVLIEDPEAHLHDNAVRQLAEWMAGLLKNNSEVRVVMETHSETFKLAVQNCVRSNALEASDVNLVWVASQRDGQATLREVPFTKEGLPTNSTLRGAFAEDRTLAAMLAGLPGRSE